MTVELKVNHKEIKDAIRSIVFETFSPEDIKILVNGAMDEKVDRAEKQISEVIRNKVYDADKINVARIFEKAFEHESRNWRKCIEDTVRSNLREVIRDEITKQIKKFVSVTVEVKKSK